MGRVQVINEIHRNKDFFCKKWVEFCQWVEDCGEQLEKYLKEHTDEYYLFVEEHKRQLNEYRVAIDKGDERMANRLKNTLDKKEDEGHEIRSKMDKREEELKQKGWNIWTIYLTRYLNIPCHLGDFPAPPDAINPLSWLFDEWNPRHPDQSEQLLLDCALLCVTHDAGVPDRKRIYHQWTYKGKYFECDKFCNNLEVKLDKMDRNGDLQRAWDDVKPKLKPETKRDISPTEEHKEKAKEIPSINIQDSNVILGDIQAKNLQIGDDACIDNQPEANKKNKLLITKCLRFLLWLWTQLKWILSILGLK